MKKTYMLSAKDQITQPKENHVNSLLTETGSPVTTICTTPFPMQPSNNKLEDEGQITGTALKQQTTTNTPERKNNFANKTHFAFKRLLEK